MTTLINYIFKITISFITLSIFSSQTLANNDLNSFYTANDTLAFKRIGSVVASPDGKKTALITMQIISIPSGKKWLSSLYIKNEGNLTQLTQSQQSISSPNWSPNGKQLAYIAKGKNFQSIWVYDFKNHKKNILFEFRSDISSFKWSPHGNYIAFVAKDSTLKQSSRFQLMDASTNDLNDRLYLISLHTPVITASPLTPATYSISQLSNPLIDSGFDWSPSNESIVFTYQPHPQATYLNQSKIAIIDLKTQAIKNFPNLAHFTAHQPSYSPNGKWIAFSSNSSNENNLNNNSVAYLHICVASTNTTHVTCLANTFNEDPSIIGWDTSSDALFIMDNYKTDGIKIYRLAINPQISPQLISNMDGYLDPQTISLNRNHQFFGFSFQTTEKSPQAFVSPIHPFKLKQISHFQQPMHKPLPKVKKISWNSDGVSIEGLLITPFNYNAQKKYPLLVMVHGGPASEWQKRYLGGCEEYGEEFVPNCFANLTSLGFIILQPNPRGSTGYGKSFRFANVGDLGGGDYRDIMSGVDDLIKKKIADSNHLAIMGWSYGGYMTAWAITQTHRFKAAIDGDGLTDFISFSGTSDIPWFLPQYLSTSFWDNKKLYLKRSPIFYVKNIQTPLLIFHGEKDVRVPLSQANELYTALRRQNKTVQLLVAPEQAHVPDNANVIYNQINTVDDWLKKVL